MDETLCRWRCNLPVEPTEYVTQKVPGSVLVNIARLPPISILAVSLKGIWKSSLILTRAFISSDPCSYDLSSKYRSQTFTIYSRALKLFLANKRGKRLRTNVIIPGSKILLSRECTRGIAGEMGYGLTTKLLPWQDREGVFGP